MSVLDEILDLQNRVAADMIGQNEIVERLMIGILSNGNLLVEGAPGLAKTRVIKALSRNIEGSFNRIQFTPDLASSDITGRQVYYKTGDEGQEAMRFEKGPIFANIVLADEINRAPSKVQNALLEAMEERQVTVGGIGHKMPDLFMVMATQNPVEQAGTYKLPEAQMDRFLMHVSVDYPDEEAEAKIIRLVRNESSQDMKAKAAKGEIKYTETPQATIFAARAEIDKITVPQDVEEYIVQLIFATRYPERYTYELKSFIRVGASPRGTLAVDTCARAYAWLQGRPSVEISDVHAVVKSVLRHRLIRGDRAIEHKVSADEIIEEIIELVDWKRKKDKSEVPA